MAASQSRSASAAAAKLKNASFLELDITVDASVARAVKEVPRLDVLINNAGYGYMAAVEEGEDAAIRQQFETNFFGLAALIRAVLPGMRKRRSGGIVNISSVGGLRGSAAGGYYCATKHAVNGLSESLALEVEPLGIRVMIVEPGPFRTDWGGRSLQRAPANIADYEATAHQRGREIAGALALGLRPLVIRLFRSGLVVIPESTLNSRYQKVLKKTRTQRKPMTSETLAAAGDDTGDEATAASLAAAGMELTLGPRESRMVDLKIQSSR